MRVSSDEPQGLGGILLLVTIGRVIDPVLIATGLYGELLSPVFNAGYWSEITDRSSGLYHPLTAPIFLAEVLGNLMLIGFGVALLYLLLTKSSRFPKLYIAFVLLSLAFLVADSLVTHWILSTLVSPVDVTLEEVIFRPDSARQFFGDREGSRFLVCSFLIFEKSCRRSW